MGYTHYWTVPSTHPGYTAAWPGIVADARRIITAVRAAGIVIAGPDGYHRPTCDLVEGIAFNGDATSDLDYETFWLQPPGWAPRCARGFCKTERRPYDLAVAAVLLRCHLLLPDLFAIGSDGDWDREWLYGAIPSAPDARHTRPGARRLVAELFGPVPDASPFQRPPNWQD
ncbi:MAG TPA: hypothetical protein VGJ07_07195 [Rugosimonospora sp.]|jgi:hypothetical protein